MLRSDKVQVVEQVKDLFDRMSSAVFIDYTGLNVAQVTELRDAFREKGVAYRVVKNTLVKRALGDAECVSKLAPSLRGMTGVAWSFEEPSAAARIAKDFAKKNDKLKIKAGLMDGQVLDTRGVENQLATLPSKDEARAMLLATMMAPAQTLVRLLSAPAQQMVGVLAAKQRQAEGA